MSERGTWLCPTALHRMRLLDMEAKLARPRAVMYGALALVFVVSIPWFGWVPFLPLLGSIVGYSLLRPRIASSEHPEYVVAATVVNAQVLIGVGIALTDQWVCVLACDLDHFKAVNDAHGHERGDQVLRDAAYILRKQLRSFELLYRLGGEEFLVVLPGLTLVEGRDVAERARAALEDARPAGLTLTASMGVAAACGADVNYDTLFRSADAALYEAKRSGRNRVVAGGDDVTRLAAGVARRKAA